MLNSELSQSDCRVAGNESAPQHSQQGPALWNKVRRKAAVVGTFSRLSHWIVKLGARGHVPKEPSAVGQPGKCLISPKSLWKRWWNGLIMLLLIFTVVAMPFRLCFIEDTPESVFVTELLQDSMFFMDILFTFNTAFYDNFDNLVTSRKAIARTYFKGWFAVDFLACVPFQLIENSGQSYNKLLRLMRLPRLYKVLKVVRLFKMVRLFRSKNATERLLQRLKASYSIIRLIYFMVSVILLVHLLGCLWYFLGQLSEETQGWVAVYGLSDLEVGDQYLVAVYWVFTTLTSVGYGDFVPQTNAERMFAIVVMVFGFGFYSFVIGNISNLLTQANQCKILKNERISTLNELAQVIQLPSELLDKAKACILFQYEANHYRRFNHASFVNFLPVRLRSTVSEFLQKQFLKNIRFFQHRKEPVLLFLIPKLKLQQLIMKDLVYLQGDQAEEVYFLNAGHIVFRAVNGVAYRHYSQGSYFGDVEVIQQISRLDTVQAVSSTVELYILAGEHFFALMNNFPDIGEELVAISTTREARHSVARHHALQLMPHAQSPQVFRSSQKLTSKMSPHFDRTETHAFATILTKNQRSQRFRYMWNNVGAKLDLQTVQGTFVSNHFRQNRCIVESQPLKPVTTRKTQLETWESLDEQLLVTLEEAGDHPHAEFCIREAQAVLNRLELVISALQCKLLQ